MNKSNTVGKILVIAGPTASGKTALAIVLAKKLNGEIVSADSRQIYRGMNIGTAKPPRDASRVKGHGPSKKKDSENFYISDSIPHHLIDIKNPDEDYSVADYKRDAVKAIRDILKRGKLPILAGGTGLYEKAVVENLDIPKVTENPRLRRELESELARNGLDALFKKLATLDPEAVYIVDPKNPRRVIRALEVAITTGKPFTAQRTKKKPLFEASTIGIGTLNNELRMRIKERVEEMMRNGLLEEVKKMHSRYGNVKALEAIGYRELIEHLDGKISLDDAVAEIKLNTWRYAKRQMTWFRKDKKVAWIDGWQAAMKTAGAFLFSPIKK